MTERKNKEKGIKPGYPVEKLEAIDCLGFNNQEHPNGRARLLFIASLDPSNKQTLPFISLPSRSSRLSGS